MLEETFKNVTKEQMEYISNMYTLYCSRKVTIPDEKLRKMFKKMTRDKKRKDNKLVLLEIDPRSVTDEEKENILKEERKKSYLDRAEKMRESRERLQKFVSSKKAKVLEVKKEIRNELLAKFLKDLPEKMSVIVNNISILEREDYVIATVTYTTTSRKTLKEEFPEVELANEWVSETLQDIASEIE